MKNSSLLKALFLTVITIIIIGIFIFIFIQANGKGSVDGVVILSQLFEQNKLSFTLVRLTLLGLFIWYWETIVRWMSRYKNWDDDLYQYVRTLRWRSFGWMLIFEIIVNQNIIAYVLTDII